MSLAVLALNMASCNPNDCAPVCTELISGMASGLSGLASIAHSIVEQQQRIRASRQASLGLPISHQRDKVGSDCRIKKAAAKLPPLELRFHAQASRFSGSQGIEVYNEKGFHSPCGNSRCRERFWVCRDRKRQRKGAASGHHQRVSCTESAPCGSLPLTDGGQRLKLTT